MGTKFSGHSDDVIVVESKGESDEFYLGKGDRQHLILPGGAVVLATFGARDGEAWNFTLAKGPDDGSTLRVDIQGPDEDGDRSLEIVDVDIDLDLIRTSDQAGEPSDRFVAEKLADMAEDLERDLRNEDSPFLREFYNFIAKRRPKWLS